MALDTRLPLIDTQGDPLAGLRLGLGTGSSIREQQQQGQMRDFEMAEARKMAKQKDAITAFTLAQDYDPLSASGMSPQDNYLRVVGELEKGGVTVPEDSREYSPQNAMELRNMIDAGGKLYASQMQAQRGKGAASFAHKTGEIFEDEDGRLFTSVVYGDPDDPTATTSQMVALDGSGAMPKGATKITTRTIQTSDEAAEAAAQKAAAEAAAKAQAVYDVEFDNFEEQLANEKKQLAELAIAKNDQERADGLIDTAGSTDAQVNILDDAIRAIDEGANTGWFASKLPSFRKATLQLEQAIKKMGIETINKATFGALSEKELALVLSTEIDEKMDEDELRGYLVEKREAMSKLAAEQRKLARHLRGGGTIESWRDLQEQNEKAEQGRASLSTGGSQAESLQSRAERLLN